MLIVLVAMMFATVALTAFIERSSTDLLVEAKAHTATRMRADAYSALEATLSVLAAFRAQLGELHSPQEGWHDAIEFSGFEPEPGRRVKVSFVDESGRIPLVNTDFPRLKTILGAWGMRTYDAERCADALLSWMKADYVPTTSLGMEEDEYQRAPFPYKAPKKSLRSWNELSAIATVREYFFDNAGAPNEYFYQMQRVFSLLDYPEPNINAAVPDAFLARDALGTDSQQRRMKDFLTGRGAWNGRGGGYFKTKDQIAQVLGPLPSGTSFDVVVRALRVTVTVREGNQAYHLQALVAPEGGAKWQTGDSVKSSNLPFAVLEIVENDGTQSPLHHAADAPMP
ncbi:MAG: type II secretion system protein GspK [Opitutaceae bacterium]|nr:type II secretion system protein GspK [Opitutaceae bacterium]